MPSKIYAHSCFYKGLRFYTRIGFSCYFRQIEYRGWENVPLQTPVIFAPNHQCAIMDAFAVLLWQKDPLVFMARADIFQSKWAAHLLRIIKMMPIYRIRDGYANLGKNEALFEEACQVLTTNHTLCLMPEGNQGNQRRLRPLVKGMFRIAFHAQESIDNHIKIVPVGIDYTDYSHSGGDLCLSFGPAIDVADYMDGYRRNPVNALNELRNVLAGRLSLLMQDIQDQTHYEDIYKLSHWMSLGWMKAAQWESTPSTRLDARKVIAKALEKMIIEQPTQWDELLLLSARLRALPGNVSDQCENISQPTPSFFSGLKYSLLFLVSLPGRMLHWPILFLLNQKLKSVKDTQMHSTFRVVVAILTFPLNYLILTILAAWLFKWPFLLALMVFLCCGLSGLLTEKLRPSIRKGFQRVTFAYRKKSQYSLLKNDFEKLSTWSEAYFQEMITEKKSQVD